MITLKVTDSFWIKNKGLVASFDGFDKPEYFMPKPLQPIELQDPSGTIFPSRVVEVEKWMRAIDYPNDSFAILLEGFSEFVDMAGWKCTFHPKSEYDTLKELIERMNGETQEWTNLGDKS